jgi:hypothetical protein
MLPAIPPGSVEVKSAVRMSDVNEPSNSVRVLNNSNVTSELLTLPNSTSLLDVPTGTHGIESNCVEDRTVKVNEPVRLFSA